MIQSVRLKFYLNEDKAKGPIQPVYLRITLDRKKSELFTGYSFDPNDWDENKQRSKKNSQVNGHLSRMESEVYDIANELEKKKQLVTTLAIKNQLSGKNKVKVNIIEFFQDHLEMMQKAGEAEPVTVKMYGYTKNHLANFLKEEKNTVDWPIVNIDYKFISDFDVFLLNQKTKTPNKKLERNTVSKHHSRLRTILIRALKEGYISKNPYADFKVKKTSSNRTYLTEEELESLIAHDLGENESLKKVRDIFIFSVYTGLRFEDAQQLTLDKIIVDKKSKYTLQLDQDKTDEPLSIPLLQPAVDIIKKYAEVPERKVFNKVLPKITNQKLNIYLKVIAELAGIRKILSHHVARHTCATTILLSNDVPIEVVSRWLGHTNIKTTQIYAKISNKYIQAVANRVDKKLQGIKK